MKEINKNGKKQLVVDFVGYKVYGEVKVRDWYGQEGLITMDPYTIDELDVTKIKEGVNDGGFGVERYIEADCYVYEVYEGDIEIWLEDVKVEF